MPVLDSDEAINACLHCNRASCPGWCDRVAGQSPKIRPWPREEEFLELYRAGLNDKEICAAMGLAPSTIWHHRQRRGLPANFQKGEAT
jgi:DNA-binding NarL/FixJ family response regulator